VANEQRIVREEIKREASKIIFMHKSSDDKGVYWKLKGALYLGLSICVQDTSESCGWIWMKFCGQVVCVTRTN